MSAKNPKAGRGPCPNCAELVLFRKSPASGRLTYSCDHCDHSAFADPGGKAHAKWAGALTDTTPEPAPKADDKPASTVKPEPAPVKRPARSVFDLGAL